MTRILRHNGNNNYEFKLGFTAKKGFIVMDVRHISILNVILLSLFLAEFRAKGVG